MIHMGYTRADVLPGFGWGYEAVCNCGWVSPPFHTRQEARVKGDVHLTEANTKQDSRG